MPLLEARQLRKSYGSHLAVADVSLSLEAGEVLGLLGPNGAGKSTTMMMLAGLLVPDRGEIYIDGRRFLPREPGDRRELGVVPQELAIYPELSALENLEFFGRLYGLRGRVLADRCAQVLDQIGLTEHARRHSGHFSGGMKRRLNFGIALLHLPRILILDEPTVGVDPQSRAHLLECVRHATQQGMAVIYASHYMEEVQTLCERVAIVDHGRVLTTDRIQNLLAGVAADVHVALREGELNGQLAGLAARLDVDHDGRRTVVIDGARSDRNIVLRQLLDRLDRAGVAVDRVETQQSNLERVFLQLTGQSLRD